MSRDSINLQGSQRLIEMLCKINHAIAYNLIEQIKYRGRSTISFLDFGEASDTISFIYSNKVQELYSAYDNRYMEKVWKEKRSEMKIGKVVKLIFGENSYPVNNPKGMNLPKPPIDIETFVNMYKAEREKNENYERFSIVKGEEIIYWYNMNNYTRFVSEDTPLGKSCLRYPESGKFLEMYLKNNDKISMLILKDDMGKLRGRAIIWNLDLPEGRTYLDRIYTVNDFDVELFKDYARRNGWLYRDRQVFGWNNTIVDGRDESYHTPNDFLLQVKLAHNKLKYYPYLDTLSVYNIETGVACNNGKLLRTAPHIHLIDYQGSYIDEVDNRSYVYSRFYDREILRNECVYCQIDDDWVYEDDSVYVHNTDGLRALRSSDKIVKSKVFSKTKFFIKESCVWSDYLKTWIFKESVREAFVDVEKTQRVIIHYRMIGKTFTKDSNGDIIKGEPSKEEKDEIRRKKEEKKKVYFDFLGRSGQPSLTPYPSPYPSGSPDQDHEIDSIMDQDEEINQEWSNEEEGDGRNVPLPRGIRRNPSNRLRRTDVSAHQTLNTNSVVRMNLSRPSLQSLDSISDDREVVRPRQSPSQSRRRTEDEIRHLLQQGMTMRDALERVSRGQHGQYGEPQPQNDEPRVDNGDLDINGGGENRPIVTSTPTPNDNTIQDFWIPTQAHGLQGGLSVNGRYNFRIERPTEPSVRIERPNDSQDEQPVQDTSNQVTDNISNNTVVFDMDNFGISGSYINPYINWGTDSIVNNIIVGTTVVGDSISVPNTELPSQGIITALQTPVSETPVETPRSESETPRSESQPNSLEHTRSVYDQMYDWYNMYSGIADGGRATGINFEDFYRMNGSPRNNRYFDADDFYRRMTGRDRRTPRNDGGESPQQPDNIEDTGSL